MAMKVWPSGASSTSNTTPTFGGSRADAARASRTTRCRSPELSTSWDGRNLGGALRLSGAQKQLGGKKLEGEDAVEPEIAGAIHDAHSAGAQPVQDLVVGN